MIYANSRYVRDIVVKDEAGRQIVLPRRRLLTGGYADDQIATVAPGQTVFALAATYGLGPENWWALALYNGLRDALSPLEPGQVLKVPSLRTLHEVLLR